MSRHSRDEDRRRNPRFDCIGCVNINYLPSNGIILPGTIRDLSLGGCWVDTPQPIDRGMRAEIVLRVNAASFRAVGEVRTVRGNSGAGMEFVQLSAGGRDTLSNLVTDLARLQAVMNALKSVRRKLNADSFKEQLENGKAQARTLGRRFSFPEKILPSESVGKSREGSSELDHSARAGKDPTAGEHPLVITIDLFG